MTEGTDQPAYEMPVGRPRQKPEPIYQPGTTVRLDVVVDRMKASIFQHLQGVELGLERKVEDACNTFLYKGGLEEAIWNEVDRAFRAVAKKAVEEAVDSDEIRKTIKAVVLKQITEELHERLKDNANV